MEPLGGGPDNYTPPLKGPKKINKLELNGIKIPTDTGWGRPFESSAKHAKIGPESARRQTRRASNQSTERRDSRKSHGRPERLYR